jgi:hypothetical protein
MTTIIMAATAAELARSKLHGLRFRMGSFASVITGEMMMMIALRYVSKS